MTIDSYDIDRIKHITNAEVIKKHLIKYFMDKGFESFNKQIFPPLLQDLTLQIPLLASKIEVIPNVEQIDVTIDKATLTWNLFVLGNQRMYLGQTFHNGLANLARQIRSGFIGSIEPGNDVTARHTTTPKKVIIFISRVLSGSESGYVDLKPVNTRFQNPADRYTNKQSMHGLPNQFFTRSPVSF